MDEKLFKKMINCINGFKPGNKKEKYEISFRLGTFTVLEIKVCLCSKEDCSCAKFRFMICNLGFEV